MLAPVIFVQSDGMRICIDVWDVCSIVEKQGGTEITYMPTDKSDKFVTKDDFKKVMECLQEARDREPPGKKHKGGDAWKNGGFDDYED